MQSKTSSKDKAKAPMKKRQRTNLDFSHLLIETRFLSVNSWIVGDPEKLARLLPLLTAEENLSFMRKSAGIL
jgi:hypothetical protein